MVSTSAVLDARLRWASALGKSFGGDRDLYDALGYPKALTFDDYWSRYERQDIAQRIIKAPVDGAWSVSPRVLDEDEQSAFSTGIADMTKRLSLWNQLAVLDEMSRVGHYAVLFFGTDDLSDLSVAEEPLSETVQVAYLRVFNESEIDVVEYNRDSMSPDYGMPLKYRASFSAEGGAVSTTFTVHASRCIHYARGRGAGLVFGIPAMKVVFNRLMDIEKLAGGSAEMYWQGAFPGLAFLADPELMIADADSVEKEIQSYVHRLRRYIKLKGIDVQQLTPQVVSPADAIDVQVSLISAATGIPKRILTGSERGELASSQDAESWTKLLMARQTAELTPMIRRVVDWLLAHTALPAPQGGAYTVQWPSLYSRNESDKADVAAKRTEALAKYVTSGLDSVIPLDVFLREVCEYPDEVAQRIAESVGEIRAIIRQEEQEGEEE